MKMKTWHELNKPVINLVFLLFSKLCATVISFPRDLVWCSVSKFPVFLNQLKSNYYEYKSKSCSV
jgi:hypothetical protein